LTQERLPLQALPQKPQFAASVCKLLHVLPHRLSPDVVHWQKPEPHCVAAGHLLLQAPQLLLSLVSGTQVLALAQNVSPEVGHLHWPSEQTSVGEHFLSHAPQLAVLLCVSTQVPALEQYS